MELPTLSMYQAMVQLKDDLILQDVYKIIKDIRIFSCVHKHPKGKLNVIQCDEDHDIGSISMKLKVYDKNVSVLVFSRKMKISGGIRDDMKQVFENTLFHDYLSEIVEIVVENLQTDVDDIKITLMNANMRLYFDPKMFLTICQKIKEQDKYDRVIMPLIANKGRFCALRIYPFEKCNSSVHFDHGGKAQFFGFNDLELLHFISEQIQIDINNILN